MISFLLFLVLGFQPVSAEVSRPLCDEVLEEILPEIPKTPSQQESCFFKGQKLYVNGLIGPKILFTLRAVPEIQEIYLHSPGGGVETAKQIAKEIRERNLTTILNPKAICASACTLLYQAGSVRLAHDDALLVYHCLAVGNVEKRDLVMFCGSNPDQYEGECLEKLNHSIESNFNATQKYFTENHVQLGMSQDFLDFFLSEKARDSKWFKYNNLCQRYYGLGASEAIAYNIVQTLIQE